MSHSHESHRAVSAPRRLHGEGAWLGRGSHPSGRHFGRTDLRKGRTAVIAAVAFAVEWLREPPSRHASPSSRPAAAPPSGCPSDLT